MSSPASIGCSNHWAANIYWLLSHVIVYKLCISAMRIIIHSRRLGCLKYAVIAVSCLPQFTFFNSRWAMKWSDVLHVLCTVSSVPSLDVFTTIYAVICMIMSQLLGVTCRLQIWFSIIVVFMLFISCGGAIWQWVYSTRAAEPRKSFASHGDACTLVYF